MFDFLIGWMVLIVFLGIMGLMILGVVIIYVINIIISIVYAVKKNKESKEEETTLLNGQVIPKSESVVPVKIQITSADHIDTHDITEDVGEDDFYTEEEKMTMFEPYTCPECYEPYDGVFCENCGHSNDIPGYEEVSEADQWLDGMMAMAMFNEMDEELKEEQAERSRILSGDFDEYDDDYY